MPEKEKECRSYCAFAGEGEGEGIAGVVANGSKLGRGEQKRPVVVPGLNGAIAVTEEKTSVASNAEETSVRTS